MDGFSAARHRPAGETLGTCGAGLRYLLLMQNWRMTVSDNRIVAVGLLTQHELDMLGHSFTRLWPVDEAPLFQDLILAIDKADRELGATDSGGDRP